MTVRVHACGRAGRANRRWCAGATEPAETEAARDEARVVDRCHVRVRAMAVGCVAKMAGWQRAERSL
jgi:hypothetical protein